MDTYRRSEQYETIIVNAFSDFLVEAHHCVVSSLCVPLATHLSLSAMPRGPNRLRHLEDPSAEANSEDIPGQDSNMQTSIMLASRMPGDPPSVKASHFGGEV